jgi:hypothetical protein
VDTQTLYLIILSVATPLAGVLGFAIQIRQVKKVRLENQKLELEVSALRAKAAEAERVIVRATNDEVRRITDPDIRFSRPSPEGWKPSEPSPVPLKEKILAAALMLGAIILIAYFVYDVYRLLSWLATAF